jgi:two-component system NtrC family sensor kinase
MKKQQILLPLFWKFTLSIILVVTVFGSLNYFFTNKALIELSNTEINRHGLSIAKIISEQSIDPLLFDDISYLDKMVSENMIADPGIAYIVIFDRNNSLIAHSFERNMPIEIVNLYRSFSSSEELTSRIIDKGNENEVIRSINMPIFNGNLGKVGIGIYEKNFTNSIKSINNFFLLMVVLFLFLGIIGALVFSYIITLPIKKISIISENLNLNSINKSSKEIFQKNSFLSFVRLKNKLHITDEIDVLTNKFNEMVLRLQTTYEDLQYAQASLFQSEKMASLGTLSAGIAHEINNPIAGIQNCIQRLEKTPQNVKQNILYLEMMNDAVNKIENVVKGLLNYSRKNDFDIEEISIENIIKNVLLLTAFQLEMSRIAVRQEHKKMNLEVLASRNHIEQVLLNLVLNSIEAIDEKKLSDPTHIGEIKFSVLERKDLVDLEISDNGIGISTDKLDSIFDPFFTLKKMRQGTGLGLTVCYSIIEQHKGEISASINSNGGLTIKVSLPKA